MNRPLGLLAGAILTASQCFAGQFDAATIPSFSTKDAPIEVKIRPDEKETMYIGHYGEVFSYRQDWTLHPPQLKDGVEIVRLHSKWQESSAKRVVKDSDFNKLENYAPLRLAQLLVIPKKNGGFEDFEALRTAKIKDLTAQGATFRIDEAPMPVNFWPKNTFQVFVTAPFLLQQIYTESEGRIFILTSGLDPKGAESRFFLHDFENQILSTLGQYFERLHRAPEVRRPETFDFSFSGSKWLCVPLFGLGLLLFGIPAAKHITRPLAAAALLAPVLAITARLLSFYAALRMPAISPAVMSWVTIPLLGGMLFYRSKKTASSQKLIVRAATLISAIMLAFFAYFAQQEIASDKFHVAGTFSLYMYWVGMLYGACYGLTFVPKYGRKTGAVLSLALLTAAWIAPTASAGAIDPASLQAERAAELALEMKDPAGSQAYRNQAIAGMTREGRIFTFQRIEISGIVATDDGNDNAPGMISRTLSPAHNSSEPKTEPKGVLQRLKAIFKSGSNDVEDINDLFDDKTGVLTARGRETIAPLMDKNVHVNEIVAHSWGAVLLNNAIKQGLINPPARIVVIGVPDNDLFKWHQLAHYTGTNVVILSNSWDMAVKTAHLADTLKNLDIQGKQSAYGNGTTAFSWTKWDKSNQRVNAKEAELKLGYCNILPYHGNSFGHGRKEYYDKLRSMNILEKTTDELTGEQEQKIQDRIRELRAKAPKLVEKVKEGSQNSHRRLIDELGRDDSRISDKLAELKELPPIAAAQPAPQPPVLAAAYTPFSSALPRVRDFAVAACRSGGQIPLDKYITNPNYPFSFSNEIDDRIADELSAGLESCQLLMFQKLIATIRAGKEQHITSQWLQDSVRDYTPIKVTPQTPPELNESSGYRPPPPSQGRTCESYGNKYCPH